MSRLLNRLRQIDPGFAVVLLLSLVAIWPLVARASLPQETDTELHIFRLMELSYLVRSGEFYPRWAPDFYHGYGYPIFNYYAPLTYYIGLIIDLMPKLGPVAGIKFVLILGFLLGALGLYGFVRDNWGRVGGYVAAAVFLYAPYIMWTRTCAARCRNRLALACFRWRCGAWIGFGGSRRGGGGVRPFSPLPPSFLPTT